MRYLTAHKRAVGKGASGTGTEHHWTMSVTAVGLAVMIPIFVIMFGRALGREHAEVLATFERPFPAILTALVLIVGMQHFRRGAATLIEDYVRGTARKITIIAVTLLSYFIMATGLFALAKIAL